MTWKLLGELPTPAEAVIIHTPDGPEEVWFGFHDGRDWRTLDGHPVEGRVLAWMPRPSVPQEGDDNGL